MSENRLGLTGILGLNLMALSIPVIFLGLMGMSESRFNHADFAFAVFFLLYGLCLLFGSVGLLLKKNWGRIVTLVLLYLMLLGISLVLIFTIGRLLINGGTPSHTIEKQLGILVGLTTIIACGSVLLNHVELRREVGIESEL